jgi:hypothetical protein
MQRERFTALPTDLLVSRVWVELPPSACVIFVDMCKRHLHRSDYRPTNNGKIGYGCAAGAKAAKVSRSTASRMLKHLQKSALIRLSHEGVFNGPEEMGLASEWEIAIYPMPGRPFKAPGNRQLHLEHWMLDSPAYGGLSNQARCILFEMMRRFDGGNNGSIMFGGATGASAGLSVDITERALNELHAARFIVQTALAIPSRSQPRQWRLTMYGADHKQPAKDFMRIAAPAVAKKARTRFIHAGDPRGNVSMMRMSTEPVAPTAQAELSETSSEFRALVTFDPGSDIRARETFDARVIRASEIHLEASVWAEGSPVERQPLRAMSGYSQASEEAQSGYKQTGQRELFGNDLLPARGPQDDLRQDLRTAFSRRRGTQSGLAKAAGLSQSYLAHALSGRRSFPPTVAAALRRWLAGEPVAGDWPPVPPAVEEPDAA